MSATDRDLQEFRRILAEQKRIGLDKWQSAPLRMSLVRIYEGSGKLGRALFAAREAFVGLYRNGAAVRSEYGVGLALQFSQIFIEAMRSEIRHSAYYLYQFYLPDRWPQRERQFPSWSQFGPVQRHLIERDRAADFEPLRNKVLFAHRCEQVDLPIIPLIGEFANGRPTRQLKALPPKDLISKPASELCGTGVESWRYDAVHGCFSNAVTDQKLNSSDLLQYFCDLSHSQQVIVQERARNHEALTPLTNGALSTIRLVTCRCPSGSIDLMPPVIRMPSGRLIADNLAQGGLAAPIDLATGVICGPALQKHNRLGVTFTDRHPDTRQELKGFHIPMWNEAIDVALRAHKVFKSVHFVGWDVAILQDGPVLLEGNAIMDLDLTVLPHGMTLSDTQFIPYYNHYWNCGPKTSH